MPSPTEIAFFSLPFQSSPLPAGLKRSHFYYASDLAEKRLSESRAAAAAAADELANSTAHAQTSSATPAFFALTAAAQGGGSIVPL